MNRSLVDVGNTLTLRYNCLVLTQIISDCIGRDMEALLNYLYDEHSIEHVNWCSRVVSSGTGSGRQHVVVVAFTDHAIAILARIFIKECPAFFGIRSFVSRPVRLCNAALAEGVALSRALLRGARLHPLLAAGALSAARDDQSFAYINVELELGLWMDASRGIVRTMLVAHDKGLALLPAGHTGIHSLCIFTGKESRFLSLADEIFTELGRLVKNTVVIHCDLMDPASGRSHSVQCRVQFFLGAITLDQSASSTFNSVAAGRNPHRCVPVLSHAAGFSTVPFMGTHRLLGKALVADSEVWARQHQRILASSPQNANPLSTSGEENQSTWSARNTQAAKLASKFKGFPSFHKYIGLFPYMYTVPGPFHSVMAVFEALSKALVRLRALCTFPPGRALPGTLEEKHNDKLDKIYAFLAQKIRNMDLQKSQGDCPSYCSNLRAGLAYGAERLPDLLRRIEHPGLRLFASLPVWAALLSQTVWSNKPMTKKRALLGLASIHLLLQQLQLLCQLFDCEKDMSGMKPFLLTLFGDVLELNDWRALRDYIEEWFESMWKKDHQRQALKHATPNLLSADSDMKLNQIYSIMVATRNSVKSGANALCTEEPDVRIHLPCHRRLEVGNEARPADERGRLISRTWLRALIQRASKDPSMAGLVHLSLGGWLCFHTGERRVKSSAVKWETQRHLQEELLPAEHICCGLDSCIKSKLPPSSSLGFSVLRSDLAFSCSGVMDTACSGDAAEIFREGTAPVAYSPTNSSIHFNDGSFESSKNRPVPNVNVGAARPSRPWLAEQHMQRERKKSERVPAQEAPRPTPANPELQGPGARARNSVSSSIEISISTCPPHSPFNVWLQARQPFFQPQARAQEPPRPRTQSSHATEEVKWLLYCIALQRDRDWANLLRCFIERVAVPCTRSSDDVCPRRVHPDRPHGTPTVAVCRTITNQQLRDNTSLVSRSISAPRSSNFGRGLSSASPWLPTPCSRFRAKFRSREDLLRHATPYIRPPAAGPSEAADARIWKTEAARADDPDGDVDMSSPPAAQVFCNCLTKCATTKCACKLAKQECSVRCHRVGKTKCEKAAAISGASKRRSGAAVPQGQPDAVSAWGYEWPLPPLELGEEKKSSIGVVASPRQPEQAQDQDRWHSIAVVFAVAGSRRLLSTAAPWGPPGLVCDGELNWLNSRQHLFGSQALRSPSLQQQRVQSEGMRNGSSYPIYIRPPKPRPLTPWKTFYGKADHEKHQATAAEAAAKARHASQAAKDARAANPSDADKVKRATRVAAQAAFAASEAARSPVNTYHGSLSGRPSRDDLCSAVPHRVCRCVLCSPEHQVVRSHSAIMRALGLIPFAYLAVGTAWARARGWRALFDSRNLLTRKLAAVRIESVLDHHAEAYYVLQKMLYGDPNKPYQRSVVDRLKATALQWFDSQYEGDCNSSHFMHTYPVRPPLDIYPLFPL